MEGWQAIVSEIESSEEKVNIGLNDSLTQLHRIQNAEGQTSKIRAVVNEPDDDVAMIDNNDRGFDRTDSNGSWSLFGSTTSSFTQRDALVMSEADSEIFTPLARVPDMISSQEQRARRRDPHVPHERSLPPILPPQDPRFMRRATLWIWDPNHSRYRINWKYLYDMRRRLESNWDLGKFTTFQFPHPLHPEEGHSECIYALQFDSNFLVSGSRDNTMRIWNVHTRRLVRPPLAEHTGSVLCLQFDADPEEDIIVSGSSDSDVIIWKFSTGEVLQKLQDAHSESVLNVRFDKRVLVTSSKDKSIKVFNRHTLRHGDMGYNYTKMFDPVGVNIRRYGYEPDLAHELLPVVQPYTMIAKLEGHEAAVNAIQISDNQVISVSGDRAIKIWDWPQSLCMRTIPAHAKGIACVEYDGRRIVSGSSDHKVYIFDAVTGVNVAHLKGHTALVRTVQAGFGDLPYSKTEDELEARRADAENVKNGVIDLGERANRRPSRGRPSSSSASRPSQAMSYGAKLPEGGGGGKVYGRIVSGSYDMSIIIWRRDKEGVWAPAHYLRQEEAALAAQSNASAIPSPTMSLAEFHQTPGCAPRPGTHPPATTAMPYGMMAPTALPMPNVHDAQPYLASEVYTAMIDQVVSEGPIALERALTNYPGTLAYMSYLQAIIQRETADNIRYRLRETVARAMIGMRRQLARNTAAASGSAASTVQPIAPPAPPLIDPHMSDEPRPPVEPHFPALVSPVQINEALEAVPAQAAALGGQVGAMLGTAAQQHIDGRVNLSPQRIFKLQFDARKIICCSQSSLIVGWDFCNGDRELEEASRFFATVG